MKKFKTPRVKKENVGHIHQPSIAEVVYTDTFETGDHKFPYAQVFVDRVRDMGMLFLFVPGKMWAKLSSPLSADISHR